MLHLNPERSIAEADPVSNSRAEHGDVGFAANFGVDADLKRPGFGYMTKALLHQRADNLVGFGVVNHTRCQPVTTRNYFSASNGAQSDGFGVPRFESNRSPGRNIEALSVRLSAVKGQSRISFDKVVMRSNLWDWLRTIYEPETERT